MRDYNQFWEDGYGTRYTSGPSLKLQKEIIHNIIKKHRISDLPHSIFSIDFAIMCEPETFNKDIADTCF